MALRPAERSSAQGLPCATGVAEKWGEIKFQSTWRSPKSSRRRGGASAPPPGPPPVLPTGAHTKAAPPTPQSGTTGGAGVSAASRGWTRHTQHPVLTAPGLPDHADSKNRERSQVGELRRQCSKHPALFWVGPCSFQFNREAVASSQPRRELLKEEDTLVPALSEFPGG